ncbi:hypothetical protein SH528x_003000 [Novipirellula sp. SH528]|uniref:hypothetical protein n=1 Tax=Novipirellula sp. SH528 TaxID=3454466 RepID=UPI003FA149DE
MRWTEVSGKAFKRKPHFRDSVIAVDMNQIEFPDRVCHGAASDTTLYAHIRTFHAHDNHARYCNRCRWHLDRGVFTRTPEIVIAFNSFPTAVSDRYTNVSGDLGRGTGADQNPIRR